MIDFEHQKPKSNLSTNLVNLKMWYVSNLQGKNHLKPIPIFLYKKEYVHSASGRQ